MVPESEPGTEIVTAAVVVDVGVDATARFPLAKPVIGCETIT